MCSTCACVADHGRSASPAAPYCRSRSSSFCIRDRAGGGRSQAIGARPALPTRRPGALSVCGPGLHHRPRPRPAAHGRGRARSPRRPPAHCWPATRPPASDAVRPCRSRRQRPTAGGTAAALRRPDAVSRITRTRSTTTPISGATIARTTNAAAIAMAMAPPSRTSMAKPASASPAVSPAACRLARAPRRSRPVRPNACSRGAQSRRTCQP